MQRGMCAPIRRARRQRKRRGRPSSAHTAAARWSSSRSSRARPDPRSASGPDTTSVLRCPYRTPRSSVLASRQGSLVPGKTTSPRTVIATVDRSPLCASIRPSARATRCCASRGCAHSRTRRDCNRHSVCAPFPRAPRFPPSRLFQHLPSSRNDSRRLRPIRAGVEQT